MMMMMMMMMTATMILYTGVCKTVFQAFSCLHRQGITGRRVTGVTASVAASSSRGWSSRMFSGLRSVWMIWQRRCKKSNPCRQRHPVTRQIQQPVTSYPSRMWVNVCYCRMWGQCLFLVPGPGRWGEGVRNVSEVASYLADLSDDVLHDREGDALVVILLDDPQQVAAQGLPTSREVRRKDVTRSQSHATRGREGGRDRLFHQKTKLLPSHSPLPKWRRAIFENLDFEPVPFPAFAYLEGHAHVPAVRPLDLERVEEVHHMGVTTDPRGPRPSQPHPRRLHTPKTAHGRQRSSVLFNRQSPKPPIDNTARASEIKRLPNRRETKTHNA
jgi:hypothetical protein